MTRMALLAVVIALVAVAAFLLLRGSASPDAAAAVLDPAPGTLVVDVRTPAEFASGHLAGARNVDVSGDFRARMDSVDRATPVVLYCRSGRRSGAAARTLGEMGFADVVNAGGFADLAAAGAATE